MSAQIRWNPLARRWVAIAGHREKRPREESLRAAVQGRPAFDPACPFCPGNEAETMPEVATVDATAGGGDGDGGWLVRVVPNKYPSFDGSVPLAPDVSVAPASGLSEVVVFSTRHDHDLGDLSTNEIVRLLRMLCARRDAHQAHPAVRHTSVIINRGGNAGASMSHGHAQILSTPFVTPTAIEEAAGFETVADLAAAAFDDGHLVVEQRPLAVSGCPTWSSLPFEAWIVPTPGVADLDPSNESLLTDVAELLGDVFRRYETVLGDIDHNVIFRFAPHGHTGPFQWHAQVLPRHTALAGFEISAGVAVNPVAPETAAERLRSAF